MLYGPLQFLHGSLGEAFFSIDDESQIVALHLQQGGFAVVQIGGLSGIDAHVLRQIVAGDAQAQRHQKNQRKTQYQLCLQLHV